MYRAIIVGCYFIGLLGLFPPRSGGDFGSLSRGFLFSAQVPGVPWVQIYEEFFLGYGDGRPLPPERERRAADRRPIQSFVKRRAEQSTRSSSADAAPVDGGQLLGEVCTVVLFTALRCSRLGKRGVSI